MVQKHPGVRVQWTNGGQIRTVHSHALPEHILRSNMVKGIVMPTPNLHPQNRSITETCGAWEEAPQNQSDLIFLVGVYDDWHSRRIGGNTVSLQSHLGR